MSNPTLPASPAASESTSPAAATEKIKQGFGDELQRVYYADGLPRGRMRCEGKLDRLLDAGRGKGQLGAGHGARGAAF